MATPELSEGQRDALAFSLARFQIGEAGGDRIAHQIDSVRLPAIDQEYRAALKLFVAEEARHGRILAQMVDTLGGHLLARTWTERLFVHTRRLLGVRFKLLVLLVAEVIGIGFYGMLVEVVPRGLLRDALIEICGDEDHHLRFHCDFFRSQPSGIWWPVAWWLVGGAAASVVLIDHRRTFQAFDIRLQKASYRFLALLLAVAEAVTTADAIHERGPQWAF